MSPHGASPAWAGGVSPYAQYPGRSPQYGGVSPMNGGGMSPNAPAQAGPSDGVSPSWGGGPWPQQPQRQPQPQQQVQPLSTVHEGGTYEANRDPRRRARAAHPALGPPPSAPAPPQAAPPALVRRTSADGYPLCTIQAASDNYCKFEYVNLTMRSGWSSSPAYLLERAMNARHKYMFQTVDRHSLEMTIMEGGRIVEWAQVVSPSQPSDLWNYWRGTLGHGNVSVGRCSRLTSDTRVRRRNSTRWAAGDDTQYLDHRPGAGVAHQH